MYVFILDRCIYLFYFFHLVYYIMVLVPIKLFDLAFATKVSWSTKALIILSHQNQIQKSIYVWFNKDGFITFPCLMEWHREFAAVLSYYEIFGINAKNKMKGVIFRVQTIGIR